MYMDYSYDRVFVSDLNEAFFDSNCIFTTGQCNTIEFENLTPEQRQIIEFSPYLRDALLIGQGGRRTISKFTPTFSHELDRQPDHAGDRAPVHGVAGCRRPRR